MEAQPLCELNSLLAWNPSALNHYLSSRLTHKRYSHKIGKVQVLSCHDLQGGYLEDRWRLGTSKINGYRFWNWWKIDTFVYFSHNFVTIPPACWIDSAHKHGVKVLGTFITEWDEGKKICSDFLKNETLWKKCADQLIEISSFYNFDGWLLNIENNLEPGEVAVMLEFVRYLTDGQKKRVKDSTVLWYDSVTRDGKLLWQNELNIHNISFFEACDGIFLNYAWDANSLNKTSDTCIGNNYKSENVFLGCDVFGSEFHRVDDYKITKNLPDLGTRKRMDCLNVAECLGRSRRHGMSFAIFAPSWSHEALGEENFVENETRFWNKLEINVKYEDQRKIASLPIVTSFCQGYGKFYCCKAEKLSLKPWSNMSLQTLQALPQPSFSNSSENSFMGGGCLKISVDEPALYRLFNIEVDLSQPDIIIKWVNKHPPSVRMVVIVTLQNVDETRGTITERYHLLDKGLKPRPDDVSMISQFFAEVPHLETTYEASKIVKLTDSIDWLESSHKIENVHGKTLKGLHLFVTKVEENSSSDDLLLGYFEVSSHGQTESTTSYVESFSSCEISICISNGAILASNIIATDPGYLNSFEIVFIHKEDMILIETADSLNEAMSKELRSEDQMGLYLRWKVGSKESPSDINADRFHIFVRKSSETDYSFLCASPIPIVKLNEHCFSPEMINNVCPLLVKVECFVY